MFYFTGLSPSLPKVNHPHPKNQSLNVKNKIKTTLRLNKLKDRGQISHDKLKEGVDG
jgi:hypothetical protein